MRKIFIITLILSSFAVTSHAETITATVNGLVCAFCASGIEKTFNSEPAVEQVKVDLESKMVTINTKQTQTLDDTIVTKLITDAGYSVVAIERKK